MVKNASWIQMIFMDGNSNPCRKTLSGPSSGEPLVHLCCTIHMGHLTMWIHLCRTPQTVDPMICINFFRVSSSCRNKRFFGKLRQQARSTRKSHLNGLKSGWMTTLQHCSVFPCVWGSLIQIRAAMKDQDANAHVYGIQLWLGCMIVCSRQAKEKDWLHEHANTMGHSSVAAFPTQQVLLCSPTKIVCRCDVSAHHARHPLFLLKLRRRLCLLSTLLDEPPWQPGLRWRTVVRLNGASHPAR